MPRAYADPPPIGYIGPVSRIAVTAAADTADDIPPVGYVGPVARRTTAAIATSAATKTASPPLGYTGPIARREKPAAPPPAPVTAEDDKDNKEKTLITATRMSLDQEAEVATAVGNVEVVHGGHVLHADRLVYDQKADIMRAEGHVQMLMPGGEVQFSDRQEITGDMKQAIATNIGILFTDNSRMAARRAQRYEGRYVVADKGMYTACNVCRKDPDNEPLWQLRADSIVHDNVEHDIYYHDVTLDFAGVPVLYTPYFSTPDPTVDRRQGFLTPNPGTAPDIGYYLRTPYYFDIAPNEDAILAPTFSEKDVLQLGGEYRRRFTHGSLQLAGTGTYAELLSESTGAVKSKRLRGNINSVFSYNIDREWRAGSEINYASDKSYLPRYNITTASDLVNRLYAERFKGRDYFSADAYYFQNLRPGTQPVQPIILPQFNYHALGEPGKTLGGRWSLDANSLNIARDNGAAPLSARGPNTRRLSASAGWERQFISDTGLVTNLSGLLRGDGYWADGVQNPSTPSSHFNNVLIGRDFEQANLTARYPLGRRGEHYQQILEPIAMISAAPEVKLDPRQPVEDSLNVQFDAANLFASNRFTGADLIEGGTRAVYGLRHALIGDGGAKLDLFGGQSYSLSRNGTFPKNSGLRDHSSDYVGQMDFAPGEWLNLNYAFRFDHHDLAPQMQDVVMSFGAPILRPSLRYLLSRQTQTDGTIGTVEEAVVGFSSTFLKYWTLTAGHTQAFQPAPGPRSTSGSLSYQDECFVFGVQIAQDDTNRLDLKSGTSVMFHLFLKNVGGVHTDSFSTPTFPAKFRQTD